MGWELRRRIWKGGHAKKNGLWGNAGGVLVGEPKEAMSGAWGGGRAGQLLQLTKARLGDEDVYAPG